MEKLHIMLQENMEVEDIVFNAKLAKLVGIISFITPLTIFIIVEIFIVSEGDFISNVGSKNIVLISLISIILDFVVMKMHPNKFLKMSIIINSLLVVLSLIPSLYLHLGVFGVILNN